MSDSNIATTGGGDLGDMNYLRVLLAFAFVIGLILLIAWLARRWRSSEWMQKMQGERRLQLVEQLYLDARNKLVLVKCDDKEHLVLIGSGSASMQPLKQKAPKEKKEKKVKRDRFTGVEL